MKKKPVKQVRPLIEEVDQEVEAEAIVKLPKGYVLNPGDKFIPHDPACGEEVDLNQYYVNTDEPPDAKDYDEPFISSITKYHNITEGRVYTYMGNDMNGQPIWEETPDAPRYVIQLEGSEDEIGSLLGRIINGDKEKNARRLELREQRLKQLEAGETVSFGELLDHLEQNEEK